MNHVLEWIIGIAIFLGLVALLPGLLRRSRKSAHKGKAGGVMMAWASPS